MDEYVQLNMNFVRALQSHNSDAALYFASEIEKKFPNHPGIAAFREILSQHSTTIQQRKAAGDYQPPVDDDEDEDEEASASDDEEDDEEEDDDVVAPAPKEPSKPTAAPPRSTSSPKVKGVSIRDFVTLHPSRELDDEMEKLFADADAQVAAEVSRMKSRKP